MSYSILQVKSDLGGLGHGTTVNKITNINSLFRRAGMNLLSKIDPAETRKIEQITLYDGVTDVAAPTGLKGNKIIDVRPQGDRSVTDNFTQRQSKDFDLYKWNGWLTVMHNGGTKYLRVAQSFNPAKLQLDDLDDDSGWAATSVAGTLVEESIIFQNGGLQFNLTGTGTGYIESSSITSQDMTDFDEKSSAFFEFYIPSAAALALITSVTLRWGNSDSVYWSRTVTAPHLGSFRVGKNLLRFDWNGATETGTVNPAAIDYARISVVCTGAISGLIVSNLFFSIGRVWDIEYYSKYIFSASGTWQETVTDEDTLINLDEPSYNLFLYESALEAAKQRRAWDDVKDIKSDLIELYEGYESDNPEQGLKPSEDYYSVKAYRRK